MQRARDTRGSLGSNGCRDGEHYSGLRFFRNGSSRIRSIEVFHGTTRVSFQLATVDVDTPGLHLVRSLVGRILAQTLSPTLPATGSGIGSFADAGLWQVAPSQVQRLSPLHSAHLPGAAGSPYLVLQGRLASRSREETRLRRCIRPRVTKMPAVRDLVVTFAAHADAPARSRQARPAMAGYCLYRGRHVPSNPI